MDIKKILSIGGALLLTGAAYWYLQNKKENFELDTAYFPAEDVKPSFYTPSTWYTIKGERKKRRESCSYIMCSYQNAAGQQTEERCVYDYEKEAICEKASGCTEKPSCS
ncbi:MAG: hypothetical protein KDK41_14515 [Leptospiraceae bacterium]|nr:hypothetical protein [Leptospiraceae bacterium]